MKPISIVWQLVQCAMYMVLPFFCSLCVPPHSLHPLGTIACVCKLKSTCHVHSSCVTCSCLILPAGEAPPRDWKELGEQQKVIQYRPQGGWYTEVLVNSEGLLAVTYMVNRCVHLTNEGALMRPIGEECFWWCIVWSCIQSEREYLSGLFQQQISQAVPKQPTPSDHTSYT